MGANSTGTPTSLGIPTLNPAQDILKSDGVNEIVQSIDGKIATRMFAPSSPSDKAVVKWSLSGGTWIADFVDPSELKQAGAVTGQAIVWSGTAWAAGTPGGIPVTSLPGSPVGGQQVIFTDSTTAPTYYWLLQWNATTAKWHYLGGMPVFTANASLTLPRAGDYLIEGPVTINTTTNSGTIVNAQLAASSGSLTGVSAVQQALGFTSIPSPPSLTAGGALLAKLTAATAGCVLSMSITTGVGTIQQYALKATPIRVT